VIYWRDFTSDRVFRRHHRRVRRGHGRRHHRLHRRCVLSSAALR